MSKLTAKRLDVAIESILEDAYGDGEQFEAFAEALQSYVRTPCPALVAGAEVVLRGFAFDGNERRGVTAKCCADNGRTYKVAAADVELVGSGIAADTLAAYRKWLGLTPYPRSSRAPAADVKQQTLELILLAPAKDKALRCRVKGSDELVTMRLRGFPTVVPGEILTVDVQKVYRRYGLDCLTGNLMHTAMDARALGLTPLALRDEGMWDPAEHYWGEEDQPPEKWEKAQQVWGPRPQFEMEQILPGNNLDDPDGDPIIYAMDLAGARQTAKAYEILHGLCHTDLRCLDAHAHLGNMVFDRSPELAIRHYEAGFRIGELSLSADFCGVLPWGLIDNRPFLRCMNGDGLCLWRLGRFEDAARIFDRMLWLNPSDNQGVRCLIDEVAERKPWRPDDY